MARHVKPTPILYGEDARRFLERMEQRRPETLEQKQRRLLDYEDCMIMLKNGENVQLNTVDDEEWSN